MVSIARSSFALRASDADTRMPPADSKKPAITADEAKLIRRWIDQGAEYDAHWAYIKPARPAVPAVEAAKWPANAIDNFMLARLEAKGSSAVARSRQADAAPPTVVRSDRPAADARGARSVRGGHERAAYEKVVDRLLGFAAFRRADGALLARRGSLCRHGRLSQRQPSRCLALSRLRDRGVQSQQAVRPVHDRAARRRPAAERRPRSSGSRRATTACCKRPKKAAPSRRNTRPSMPPTASATRR